MYSFDSRVRYSEVDASKHLDLHAIINYFQDCSTFHSEDVGLGLDYFEQMHKVWMLNGWQIHVNRYPRLYEKITICTSPYDFNNIYGFRNFLLKDEQGDVVAYANSIWFLMDTLTMKPSLTTSIPFEQYGIGEKYDMEYAPRKIKLPTTFQEYEAFPVAKSNIDTNNHVNNGQYIKMAEEYLPDGFIIEEMRAEYRRAAVLGDLIYPRVSVIDNLCTVVLAGEDERPYCIVEFKKTNN